jgi:hypothetical protein
MSLEVDGRIVATAVIRQHAAADRHGARIERLFSRARP